MLFKNIVEIEDESDYITGDVTGDGKVNGTDLVALASIVLGKQAEVLAADVNSDGKINGTDIVALANIILGRPQSSNIRKIKQKTSATSKTFTAQTQEGVEMKFLVLDEVAKTCQVGTCTKDVIDYISDDDNAINWQTSGTITIPSQVNGYTVISIGSGAFSLCTKLTDIIIPESVRSIGAHAFSGCSIKGINLPSNLETIGSHAFHESGIESINIPATVLEIGDAAFSLCEQLKTITSFIEDPFDLSEEASAHSGWTIFGGCDLSSITLYVPYGTKAKYQSTKVWKDFPNIVEMEAIDPDLPEITNAHLSIQQGFNIKPGESKVMTIDLTNPSDELTLVQFDLTLPQGLSIKTVGGELDIDMCDRTTWRKHSLDANAIDGGYRFLLYSGSNALISGTEGGIITVTLVADNSFKGGKIMVDNTLLVTPDQKEITPTKFEYNLGGDTPALSTASLSIEDFSIDAGGEATMTIDLTNPIDELTLVQFDLTLPQGLSIKTAGGDLDIDMCDRTTWRKHSLDANAIDGGYRFLLYSGSNALISGTEGGIITIKLVANSSFKGGKIVVDNTLLVTPDQNEINPVKYEYSVKTSTAITMIETEQSPQRIYNLMGQKIQMPRKGIAIINGKKVMIR